MKDNEYSNHHLALDEISKELGIPRYQVREVIYSVIFRNIGTYIKFPNIVKWPLLGKMVPDMRRYRHIEDREKKLEKLKRKFLYNKP